MRRPLAELEPRYAPRRRRSYSIEPDGRIVVDEAKRHVFPFWLTTEPEEITVPAASLMGPDPPTGVPILAGGLVEQPAIMPIDNKGPFEVCYSSFKARLADGTPTSNFTVVLFEPGHRPVLMNREVHIRTLAGGFGSTPIAGAVQAAAVTTAGRPLVWPETWFMEPEDGGKALFVGFRNLTLTDIFVRFTLAGVRYYSVAAYEEALKERERMFGKERISYPYFYTTDTDVALAAAGAGASAEFDMRITDEADVEVFKMTHFSDAPFLWRIQEKAGKRFLDSAGLGLAGAPNGVHSALGWGDAEFPFIPFETLYLEQNSKLMLNVVNASSPAQGIRVWPTFVCRKIVHKEEFKVV